MIAEIVISAIPAVIGYVIYSIVKNRTDKDTFDSQVCNIKNGKCVDVEFKKSMTKAEIAHAMELLNHLND